MTRDEIAMTDPRYHYRCELLDVIDGHILDLRNGRGAPSAVVPPLKAQSGHTKKGDAAPCVATAMAVRRLTPRECERLQGFADDYTLISYRGKPAADGRRYKSLGNSMAVPVMSWIGQRLQQVLSC